MSHRKETLPVRCRVLNLATPDARHRRPLKFFLYYPSVKKQSLVQGNVLQTLLPCIAGVNLNASVSRTTWVVPFIILLRKSRAEVPKKERFQNWNAPARAV